MNEKAPVAIIGGGPAGLIAAEVLSAGGVPVIVFERMASVGRKFLMAGRGGLNLTHSEPLARFKTRYGAAEARLGPMLDAFTPDDLVAWAETLGQSTFVGSSGRLFPRAMKASPLLRAWLARLAASGVEIRSRARWLGWTREGALEFEHETLRPAATLLALGGASWPKLGADGSWTELLAARGVEIAPLRPANVGFETAWSERFADRFAGTPLKGVALSFAGRAVRGEAMITAYGVEGGALYALSAHLRDAIGLEGAAIVHIDLKPALSEQAVAGKLARAKTGDTLSSTLRKTLGLAPVAANLLRERPIPGASAELAALIKAFPLKLDAARGLERAISTAGGVAWAGVDETLQLNAAPGVYVAGEMLDWEAPTGGYLLQACFSTGVHAARAILAARAAS